MPGPRQPRQRHGRRRTARRYNGSFRGAPRVGFAWDVTGDGRTAVRGGAGVFFDRYGDGVILPLVEAPPLVETRSTNFTTLPTLLSAPLVASTNPTVLAFDAAFKPPVVYNWSIGVQRELPFAFIADVAYVGNANRNIRRTVPDQRRRPTERRGPTSTRRTRIRPATTSRRATDFLRPYVGLPDINRQIWKGAPTTTRSRCR